MLKPPSGWSSLVVLGLMLLSVAWLVQALDWTEGLGILTPVVLLAVITGAVLGRQLWLPASLAHGWSIVIGLATTLMLGTVALEEYVTSPDNLVALPLTERLSVVRDWFMEWLTVAVDGGTVPETTARFVFVLWMAMLMWLVSYIAAWFLTRYVNWWGAVLPAGFAMLANLYHAPPTYLTYMAFFLICAFVLAAQSHLTLQQEEWHRRRIGFSPDIGLSFLRDGFMVTVAVIGIAWIAPTQPTSQRLHDAVSSMRGRSRELGSEFTRLFPSLDYPARGSGSSFGNELALGGSISLGSQPIFDARVSGVPEGVDQRYWRLATFDTYTGAGWRRNADAIMTGGGLDNPLADDAFSTSPITQTITTLTASTTQLFAAPQPSAFSIGVRAEVAGGPDSTDVLAVNSVQPLTVGERYFAISRLSTAGESQLRGARLDVPAPIARKYLQLPPDLPTSVTAKAAEVTQQGGTQYDKAKSIESFLRGFEYSETITPPPAGRDLVEWFLFDEQRGYCDYYSSSFVVMARSVGIPARVAAGYATGELIEEMGVYRQHEYDAHTWPEVFFPEFGWVEFEPTAAEQTIARMPEAPQDPVSSLESEPPPVDREEMLPDDMRDPNDPLDAMGSTSSGPEGLPERVWAWLLVLAVGALVPAAVYMSWQRQFRGLSAAEGAFARLMGVARWLGIEAEPADTPYEYGARLSARVPAGQEDIETITSAYVGERFGRRSSDDRGPTLRAAWQRLQRPLARSAARLGLSKLRRAVTTESDDGSEAGETGRK